MTLQLIRKPSRLMTQGRAIVLGAVVALACSACASEEVASAPAGAGMGMPPSMTSTYAPPKGQVASAPTGYSTPSSASMPMASSGSASVTR